MTDCRQQQYQQVDNDEAEQDIAVGALPLAMESSSGGGCHGRHRQQQQRLVGTDVNIGDLALTGRAKPVLERFCDATDNPAEKAKALELLTALEMSSAIKAEAVDGRPVRALTPAPSSVDACEVVGGRACRPRTAAPRLQSPSRGSSDCVKGYETTHNHFFQPPEPSPSQAVRPASSQMQRPVPPPKELPQGNAFGDLFMTTTYGREFFAKSSAAAKPAQERAASARGVRNNNPHPNREFLVWRYRRPTTATERIEATVASESGERQEYQQQQQRPQLTNESFDRAVRGKCHSTYRHDFLGGRQPTSMMATPPADEVAQTFDRRATSTRDAYGPPARLPTELAVEGARFGRGRGSVAPAAVGIIPAGGLAGGGGGGGGPHGRTRTTYEAHICEPADRAAMRVADLRQLSSVQNAQAVARLIRGATGGERAALAKLYREMQSRMLPVSIPMPVERRILKERVGGHMRLPAHPAWMSTWTGPT